MTEEEIAILKTAAKDSGMGMADFILAGVHQTRRIVVPGAGQLRAELFYAGKNLNQAVRLAHIARKERQKIDITSIENAANQVGNVVDNLNNLLTKWNVDLTYQNQKGGKQNADCEM